LPRMQRTRAIPVAWLNSGLCPDRPNGWIPIIIIKNNIWWGPQNMKLLFMQLCPVSSLSLISAMHTAN